MDLPVGLLAVVALLIALPVVVQRYLQRLPVAPACPTCRTVTRQVELRGWAQHLLPLVPSTILGECTHCGWKGRMRWRWATGSAARRER